MLTHLHISNYALIESLDIDLYPGFSVITGETGAGKSILLGAIGLLLGGRADTRSIQAGKTRCILEAHFDLGSCHLEDFFQQNDLDFDGRECIIRRELTQSGKSRAFINDTPASVAQLRALGSQLLDIHSQHQNLLLANQDFQLSVLDIIAQDGKITDTYHNLYRQWQDIQQQLEQAISAARQDQQDMDYLHFQYQQLQEFAPVAGEDQQLQQECDTLEHAQEIGSALLGADSMIAGDDGCILDTLRHTQNIIQGIQRVYPDAGDIAERLESCRIELKDISSELSSRADSIEYDPQRLEFLHCRLDTLYSLEQKHHVSSSEELVAIMEQIGQRLETIDNSDENIQMLQNQLSQVRQQLDATAQKLTQMRQKAVITVQKQMILRLQSLGIPNVQFNVDIQQRQQPGPDGMDIVTFMFSANKNTPLQPISQVASGGEIARVMLSLKALISSSVSLPTIIFDEIDTGVSGKIAEAMATIMKDMGNEGRQVISITHLPQIAAMGSQHYRVFKQDTDDTTLSHITQLDAEQRITEIANMLSGSEITQAAIDNARALLSCQ